MSHRQQFNSSPTTLGELQYLVYVVCSEMATIGVWKVSADQSQARRQFLPKFVPQASSWFFVSLIQQFLNAPGHSDLPRGVKFSKFADDILSRIKERLRLFYNIPNQFSVRVHPIG